jgi:hypothetical protein
MAVIFLGKRFLLNRVKWVARILASCLVRVDTLQIGEHVMSRVIPSRTWRVIGGRETAPHSLCMTKFRWKLFFCSVKC